MAFSGDGCGAVITVVERRGKVRRELSGAAWAPQDVAFKVWGGASKIGPRASGHFGSAHVSRRWSALFAAMGHPQRIRILYALLDGPAVYRKLKRLTKLKEGPLYHHVNQLRLARLLRPKVRDIYELSDGGRLLLIGLLAVVKLAPLK